MELSDAIAAAYPLGPIRACERIERESSSVARVELGDRVYWLKLAARALDDLESEAEVASELAQRGLRVTASVQRCDGRYAGTLDLPGGPVPAVLFAEAPGTYVEAPSPAQAEALGALLARFHATAVPAANQRWRIDADALGAAPLHAVETWLQRAGGDGARTCAELATLAAEMAAIARPDELPSGLCHGDVHLENVHFDGAQPTLLDLECCGPGPCAYDLACYWRKRIGLAPADADPPHAEWDALLRGYAQVRPVTPAERRAIPALATLRAIWVMALPAAPGTTWGQDCLLDPEYIEAHVAMIERLADRARS